MEPDPLLSDPRHVALLAENAELRAELVRLRGTMERLEKLLETVSIPPVPPVVPDRRDHHRRNAVLNKPGAARAGMTVMRKSSPAISS